MPKKGYKKTQEQRDNHRKSAIKSGVGKWNKGKRTGEKSNWWKGGITKDKNYISWLKNKRNRMPKIGSHTFDEWEKLKAQYNWTCPCCHKSEPEIKLTQDHIIPLSKGGSDNIENIQPLCKSCNSRKHTKIIKYE